VNGTDTASTLLHVVLIAIQSLSLSYILLKMSTIFNLLSASVNRTAPSRSIFNCRTVVGIRQLYTTKQYSDISKAMRICETKISYYKQLTGNHMSTK